MSEVSFIRFVQATLEATEAVSGEETGHFPHRQEEEMVPTTEVGGMLGGKVPPPEGR